MVIHILIVGPLSWYFMLNNFFTYLVGNVYLLGDAFLPLYFIVHQEDYNHRSYILYCFAMFVFFRQMLHYHWKYAKQSLYKV